jgi:hypothetical protein
MINKNQPVDNFTSRHSSVNRNLASHAIGGHKIYLNSSSTAVELFGAARHVRGEFVGRLRASTGRSHGFFQRSGCCSEPPKKRDALCPLATMRETEESHLYDFEGFD